MSLTALEDDSEATYTHFAHRAELGKLLLEFTREGACYSEEELDGQVKGMGAIVSGSFGVVSDLQLDNYLPLPGLLDPALHEIVPPLMGRIAGYLRDLQRGDLKPDAALSLLATGRVVNWVVKVRGWKATSK